MLPPMRPTFLRTKPLNRATRLHGDRLGTLITPPIPPLPPDQSQPHLLSPDSGVSPRNLPDRPLELGRGRDPVGREVWNHADYSIRP